jgi:hypothetical protein
MERISVPLCIYGREFLGFVCFWGLGLEGLGGAFGENEILFDRLDKKIRRFFDGKENFGYPIFLSNVWIPLE